MSSLPLLKPREVVKAFEKLGWEVVRQRSSHIILTKEGHIATLSVPNHPEVARGTLRSLIARAGINMEEFLEALVEKLTKLLNLRFSVMLCKIFLESCTLQG